jgi:hypothetical protein
LLVELEELHDLSFLNRVGEPARHEGETRVVCECFRLRNVRNTALKQLHIETVEIRVCGQHFVSGRDRLEGIDASVAAGLSGEEREHSDVCADVENTIAVFQTDAVSQVDLTFEDLFVEVVGFTAILVNDDHPVRQFILR